MAKFIRRGKARVDFLPTVANPTAAPTTAEVSAGQNLTPRIADMAGWQLQSAPVPVPNLADRFVGNIPGEQTVETSSLTFYADDATTDAIKTAMPVDQVGYIYVRHSGTTAGSKADLFPVRVSSIGNEYSLGNEPARYVVTFAITGPPAIDVTSS